MPEAYEEIIDGETLMRRAPGARHEAVCQLLHARVAAALECVATSRLLEPRSVVQLSSGTLLRPDLTLVTVATGKPWLIAEIVDSSDHRTDTVVKKEVYELLRIPRLWMIDPRYDNVEIYHGGPHGLALQRILAGSELVTEALLADFKMEVVELFKI